MELAKVTARSLLLLVLLVAVRGKRVAQVECRQTYLLEARLRGGSPGMAFKFDFGSSSGGGGDSAGFKFNFGGGEDTEGAEPVEQEKKPFSFDDLP